MDKLNHLSKTWHEKHADELTYAQRLSDKLAGVMGSWQFIIFQSVIVLLWVIMNVMASLFRWDPYPFILLNLLFSTQAAYAAPIIMMSQNRQNQRDRIQAKEDFMTNISAKKEIEELQKELKRLEIEKLDKLMAIVENIERKNK
jgi:uncharacterized membrane protein